MSTLDIWRYCMCGMYIQLFTYLLYFCFTEPFTRTGGPLYRTFTQLWLNEFKGCGLPHDFLWLGAFSLRTWGMTTRQRLLYCNSRSVLKPKHQSLLCVFFFFWQLELIYHTFGRQNVKKTTVNLDLFLRRFNEIQFWVITEMCLCSQLSKRVQLLKKFIKIATQYAKTVSPSALFIAVFFICAYVLILTFKAARNTRISMPSLLSPWDWATQQCAGWTRPGKWVFLKLQSKLLLT